MNTLPQPMAVGFAALLLDGGFEQHIHMNVDVEQCASSQADMVIGHESENDSPNDRSESGHSHDLYNEGKMNLI